MEQGNGYLSEGGDRTAHAERLLASRAARTYDVEFLSRCTLYTSAEPCAMCAGAIYWAGIGRVVYGQTEKALRRRKGAHEENPTLDLPCDIVFAAGQRTTEVVGPLLEAEAAALQADFWGRGGIVGVKPPRQAQFFHSFLRVSAASRLNRYVAGFDPDAGPGERWQPTRRVDGFVRRHSRL